MKDQHEMLEAVATLVSSYESRFVVSLQVDAGLANPKVRSWPPESGGSLLGSSSIQLSWTKIMPQRLKITPFNSREPLEKLGI